MMNSKLIASGFLVCSLIAMTAQCQTTPESSGREIAISEELWLQLSDEPGMHLQAARDRFSSDDRPGAARHMRRAVVYLKIAAQNTTRKTLRNLQYSATELEGLARGVESGTVRSINTLEHAFSRAEHALAQHHYALASESWAKRETRVAGFRLRAAGNATERAARWSGKEVSEGASAVYRGTRTLGGNLIEGTGVVVNEVGKGFEVIGQQIEKVGGFIAPRK